MVSRRQEHESSHSRFLRDAQRLLLQRKLDIAQGRLYSRPSDVPLLETILYAYVDQTETASTRLRYSLSAEVLIHHFGKGSRISDLNPFAIDGFKAARRASGVSPAGVNRDLALLRASLNVAVERRLIPFSPFSGVKLFKEENYRKAPLSLSFEDEKRVLACCDARLSTLVRVLIDSGLRVGVEALPLRWTDIDFSECTIRVARSKTAAGRRIVPMTTSCKNALLEWRTLTAGNSEFVFFNPRRPATHIKSVKTAWHNALKASGLQSRPLYQTRHTFTTRLAAAGISDSIIDQLLGHSRRDVLRFYTARVTEYLRDAITELERFRALKTNECGSQLLELRATEADTSAREKEPLIH